MWRLPLLRSEHRLESLVSREATFLFNNLLLLALAFAILWGVIFPVLSEAVRGVRRDRVDALLRLLPGRLRAAAAGADRHRAGDRLAAGVARQPRGARSAGRSSRPPRGAALLGLLGLGSSPAGLTAFSLCIFVTVTIGLEFARGTAARRAIAGGSWPRALVDLVSRNRRRYGGYVVHLAIVLLVVGVTASSAYSSVREATLRSGESMRVDGYTLTYRGLVQRARPTRPRSRPCWTSRRGGQPRSGRSRPASGSTRSSGRVTNEVDIRTSFRRGDRPVRDPPGRLGGRPRVTIKALVNPMVGVIWLAGLVFLLGARDHDLARPARGPPARPPLRRRAGPRGVTTALEASPSRRPSSSPPCCWSPGRSSRPSGASRSSAVGARPPPAGAARATRRRLRRAARPGAGSPHRQGQRRRLRGRAATAAIGCRGGAARAG